MTKLTRIDELLAASTLIEKLTRRELPDGRAIALRVNLFNVRLVLEVDMYTEDGWCYANFRAAQLALHRWDPYREEEPTGWIKHPATGRRRLSIFCSGCGAVIGSLEYKRW